MEGEMGKLQMIEHRTEDFQNSGNTVLKENKELNIWIHYLVSTVVPLAWCYIPCPSPRNSEPEILTEEAEDPIASEISANRNAPFQPFTYVEEWNSVSFLLAAYLVKFLFDLDGNLLENHLQIFYGVLDE